MGTEAPGLVNVPLSVASGVSVRLNLAIISSTATNVTDAPLTATSVTTRPVAFSEGTPMLATHTDLAFLARSSVSVRSRPFAVQRPSQ